MSRSTRGALSVSLALVGLIVAGLIVSAERLSAAEVPVREGFDALGISGVVLGGSVVVLWFAASALVAAGWLDDIAQPGEHVTASCGGAR
jgi:Ca2+/H+ antiporter